MCNVSTGIIHYRRIENANRWHGGAASGHWARRTSHCMHQIQSDFILPNAESAQAKSEEGVETRLLCVLES